MFFFTWIMSTRQIICCWSRTYNIGRMSFTQIAFSFIEAKVEWTAIYFEFIVTFSRTIIRWFDIRIKDVFWINYGTCWKSIVVNQSILFKRWQNNWLKLKNLINDNRKLQITFIDIAIFLAHILSRIFTTRCRISANSAFTRDKTKVKRFAFSTN